jgi:hypothetical protein
MLSIIWFEGRCVKKITDFFIVSEPGLLTEETPADGYECEYCGKVGRYTLGSRLANLTSIEIRARIFKRLRSSAKESIPPANVAGAGICKSFKGPRNRFQPGGPVRHPYS